MAGMEVDDGSTRVGSKREGDRMGSRCVDIGKRGGASKETTVSGCIPVTLVPLDAGTLQGVPKGRTMPMSIVTGRRGILLEAGAMEEEDLLAGATKGVRGMCPRGGGEEVVVVVAVEVVMIRGTIGFKRVAGRTRPSRSHVRIG